MHKLIAAAAAAVVLLVACTSGDDGGSSGSPTTEGATSPEAGRAPGVTEETIKLGVSYVDLEAISEVTNIDHGDYEAAYQALIDDVNARGGIHGRTIEPVFAPVSPIGTQPAEEACVRLTEDEPVFAAIGQFIADAPLCYLEAHETAVIGGSMTPERLDRATAPWFTTEAGSDLDDDAIRAFSERGLLDGDVAVFAALPDEALVRGEIEPLLEELDVEPVEVAVLDAPENDPAAQNAATAVIAERFRSAGADTVLVVGVAGLSWANGTEATDYRPQALYTRLPSIAAYYRDAAGRDLSVLDGAYAAERYGSNADRFAQPSMQDCLGVLEDAGIELTDPADLAPGDPEPHVSAFHACWHFTLFTAIAEAAGENLDYATFRQAGENLGEITIPGFPDPFQYGPPPAADGDPPAYVFAWDPDAQDFVLDEGQEDDSS
jgi:hypothetical protein